MKVFAFTLVLVFFTQSAAKAGWFDKWENHDNVPYGKTDFERADLYVRKQGTNNPAVIIVHGGGWAGGKKEWHQPYAEALADKNLTVMSINYRLINKDFPNNHWPAQIQDVQLAVRWLRAHAQKYRIDPMRICALGDSAGGHLALMLGSLKKNWPGDRSELYADQSPAVSCVVDMFGPTDLANPNFNKDGRALIGLFGGKTVSDDPELYAKASPIKIANSKTAPTLIVQGSTDTIVPLAQSTDFDKVLKANGVQSDVIIFNGGHWFDSLQGWPDKKKVEETMFNWLAYKLKPAR